ncbi:MAG: UDPGP type 1 family protein, partial [Myxococcota bacterium]
MAVGTAQGRSYEAIHDRFHACGQSHVFQFWDQLDASGRRNLLEQASAVDLEALGSAHSAYAGRKASTPPQLESVPIERLPAHGGDPEAAQRASATGTYALAAGRIAVLVVAGGQATRLGFAGPKGSFPVGPITGRTLFGQQAQKILGLRRRYGQPMPWYVMTSEATDAATRKLFAAADFFGLPERDVMFFQQEMIQSVDFDGCLILERPDRIFENPNGHGGSLTALLSSGALDDMQRRGVDTVFYYQVDNPLIRMAVPTYLGFHLAAEADMSAKVIQKRDPMEKVGVVARADGRVGIVEYTEISDKHRFATEADGSLRYWAGNTAIHAFSTQFIRRVAQDADVYLPYHASAKKIPTLDEHGARIAPAEPNGLKFERFVFDALGAAKRVCVVEGDRAFDYSPIK